MGTQTLWEEYKRICRHVWEAPWLFHKQQIIYIFPMCELYSTLISPCGSAGKKICPQCGRPGFDPWVGKIPRRRERLPTPVFWPGEFHGLYSSRGCKELDMTVTFTFTHKPWASQVVLVVKNPPTSARDIRDVGSVPRSGRSSGGGHGNRLQYSYLENSIDRWAWKASVHKVEKKSKKLDTTEVTYHTSKHSWAPPIQRPIPFWYQS